ncbi:MAG: lipopolysaccharide biosynthesis protein [Marinobacter sp.]|nr:lipopolysaccharide biosynthesis protein [Marinobacter sp.]
MSQVRRSVIFSSFTRYSIMLISLASTMVVARLLTPDEIGTYAVASAIIMIINEFRILGAGDYLVREAELSVAKVQSAMGLTILISWSLGVLVFMFAPLASEFFGYPAVLTIFQILSLNFFLAPLVSIPFALLTRDMKFNLLFRAEVLAVTTNLFVTVSLIYAGMSYYSLAWGHTASTIILFVLLTLFLRPERMSYRPRFKGISEIASLGIFNSLANILRKATVTVPDIVIGKMGTTYQVGIFSKGLGFVQFLSQTLMMGVSPVALPYLSGARREGGDVRFAYQRASVLLGGMVWPVLAVGSLASLPAIRLFFGDQWDAAAPLASSLAIWAALRSVHWFSNEVLLAVHQEKIMALKDALVFGVLLVGIVLAFSGGLERIAQVFVLAGFIEVALISWVLRVYIALPFLPFLRVWLPNIFIAGGCALATLGLKKIVDFSEAPPWQPAILLAVVMPPIWLILLYIFRHPLYLEFRDVFVSFRKKLSDR